MGAQVGGKVILDDNTKPILFFDPNKFIKGNYLSNINGTMTGMSLFNTSLKNNSLIPGYFGEVLTRESNKDSVPTFSSNFNNTIYAPFTLNLTINIKKPMEGLPLVIKNKGDGIKTYRKKKNAIMSIGDILYIMAFSPRYGISNNSNYKFIFEPISFCFAFRNTHPSANFNDVTTIMTDYKFYFDTKYLLTLIVDNSLNVKIFINGNQESIISLPVFPWRIMNGRTDWSTNFFRNYRTRSDYILQPNFKNYNNQTVQSYLTRSLFNFSNKQFNLFNSLMTVLIGDCLNKGHYCINQKPPKKTLIINNNIQYGQLSIYNRILTNNEIKYLYNISKL